MAGKRAGGKGRGVSRLISDRLLRRVLDAASSLPAEVELLFFGSTAVPSTSLDALRLCRELASASPKVRIRVFDAESDRGVCEERGVLFFPATMVQGRNRGRMRFHGVPGSHSLQALVEAIRASSTGDPGLRADTRDLLSAINKPLRLRAFVHSASPLCARLTSLALRLAVESPFVVAEVFSLPDFPALAAKYGVESAPRTLVNEALEIRGAPDEKDFVEEALGALVPRANGYL